MLKYKFEKYILLVARIKKNKIFNFKSDLHWTWIHIYSSFVLGNFGSQAVAAVWTTVNDLEKMFVYRLSLFPFSRFFHPFPKQKGCSQAINSFAPNLALQNILAYPGADSGGKRKSKRAVFFSRPFRLSLVPTISPWATRKRPNFGGCLRSCIGVLLRTD